MIRDNEKLLSAEKGDAVKRDHEGPLIGDEDSAVMRNADELLDTNDDR